MRDPSIRLVAGCMTGTSLDGLDVSLVEVCGEGLTMRAKLIGTVSAGLDELADALAPMAEGRPHTPVDYMRAARRLGELHAQALEKLCREFLPADGRLSLIAAHGQTVWHAPDEGVSWQLLDPQPIVNRLGAPVCFDLRQADLIAGGQGAPITPISDWVMFRHPDRDRLIVNLGGISNVTYLPASGSPRQVQGADIGPCNLLIDGVVRRLYPDRRFDTDGKIAKDGRIDLEVFGLIERHPAITGQATRSLGREDFTDSWISDLVDKLSGRLTPADIVASAIDTVARLIARSPLARARDVVLAGGGARNPVLTGRLRELLAGQAVMLSDEIGVPVEARESAGFAVLGALSRDGVPISLPQITGASDPGVAGHWVFPGATK